MSKHNKYAYFHENREDYTGEYNTREEALAAGKMEVAAMARHLDSVVPIFTGKLHHIGNDWIDHFDKDYMSDDIEDRLIDSVAGCMGDFPDGFELDITPEQEKELSEDLFSVLCRWIEKHGLIKDIYSIVAEEEHEPPTEADIQAVEQLLSTTQKGAK